MTQLRDEQVHRCLSPEPGPLDLAAAPRPVRHGCWSCWRRCPPNQREVVRLKFQNGFSYQEISRISGHSVSNVGYLIHAGIKALRVQLFARPGGRELDSIERRTCHDHRSQRSPADRLRARRARSRPNARSSRPCSVESAECRQAVEEIRLTAQWLTEQLHEESRDPRAGRRSQSSGRRGEPAATSAHEPAVVAAKSTPSSSGSPLLLWSARRSAFRHDRAEIADDAGELENMFGLAAPRPKPVAADPARQSTTARGASVRRSMRLQSAGSSPGLQSRSAIFGLRRGVRSGRVRLPAEVTLARRLANGVAHGEMPSRTMAPLG